MSGSAAVVRRVVDVAAATIGLAVTAPVVVVAAGVVRVALGRDVNTGIAASRSCSIPVTPTIPHALPKRHHDLAKLVSTKADPTPRLVK